MLYIVLIKKFEPVSLQRFYFFLSLSFQFFFLQPLGFLHFVSCMLRVHHALHGRGRLSLFVLYLLHQVLLLLLLQFYLFYPQDFVWLVLFVDLPAPEHSQVWQIHTPLHLQT